MWAAWAAPPDPDSTWATLEDRLRGVTRVRRLHRLAVDRRLRLAALVLALDLAARVAEVRDLLGRILVEARSSGGNVPDPVEWGREVRHLEDEFGRVEVRWGDAAVRVVTDPIRLDGIDLGRFAVEFHWKRVATRSGADCFDVVALDPNPAAGRRDVTHPHVRDHDLCAGDAERPLDRAIRDGRLGDAFVLVRSVLGTYNPDSPHVPLADWDGFVCGDCGRTGRPDDRYSCEGCESDLCDGCSRCCPACSIGRCSACLEACEVCESDLCPGCLEAVGDDRRVCPACLVPCPKCHARVPKDDLTDPTGRCPGCAGEDDEQDGDVGSGEAGRPGTS